MTDDQGYGDFGVQGNPLFKTPRIDRLAEQSASMEVFYVCPVCSPTRSSLMTGRYNYRTRCIDTYRGRSQMAPEEITLAEALQAAGYATGIFGKWHLGDAYPMRPIDQGFDKAVVHRGGGLAQDSEPIENRRRYTDPILLEDGQKFQADGYCTDVYFDRAMQFIEKSQATGQNFFAYIATNTPHSPFHDVPAELYEQYKQVDFRPIMKNVKPGQKVPDRQDKLARIAAMITNIDQNVGRLLDRLDQLDAAENTIVIYMVDNGPNSRRYAGPFRGHKGTVYEGGIRSPFWIRWPAVLASGTASQKPVAHIDVTPTLLEACGAPLPEGVALDGRSFLGLLRGEDIPWPSRTLATQWHRGDVPERYHHFMIRDDRWKLLNPSNPGDEQLKGQPAFELYDLANDPGEQQNLAERHPEHVARLRKAYDRWFDDVSSTRDNNYAPPRIVVGSPAEPTTTLTPQDARGPGGGWLLSVTEGGFYTAELRFDRPLPAGRLKLMMNDQTQTVPVEAGAETVRIDDLVLQPGPVQLKARVVGEDQQRPGYHVILSPRS